MSVAGGSSTGSKRPSAWFGPDPEPDLPAQLRWSAGAKVGDARGREYLDFGMSLGAVALGYGYPAVTSAVRAALDHGGLGPFPPEAEAALAEELSAAIPWLPQVRFFKTGAEAVAGAIRLARIHTGRTRVIGCGYHGWLDGTSDDPGVPNVMRQLYRTIPFNDSAAARSLIREQADDLALVIVEPVVDGPPTGEWLATLREEAGRVGALLAFDEIKAGFRVALGGGGERWAVRPDLAVFGKALANGFPLAVLGGRADVMAGVERTWISSTLAAEPVALAAARATLATFRREPVMDHLERLGAVLHRGLRTLAEQFPDLVTDAPGVPAMCYLRYHRPEVGHAVTRAAARRGLLFKPTGYDFVSFAHGPGDVERAINILRESLTEVRR